MDVDHTRRRLLATASGLTAATLAGCLGSSDNNDTNGDGDGNTAGAGGNGDAGALAGWPSYGYDIQNTGYHPTTTGPKDGVEEAWSTDIDDAVTAPPVIADGTAFWVSANDDEDTGTVYAVDTSDGTIQWEMPTDSQFTRPAAVVDGTVYAENGRTIMALDAATGEKQWSVNVLVRTTPVVHDGSVYALVVDERSVAVTDYFIYEFDAETGDHEVLREYSRDEDEGGAFAMEFSPSFAAVGDTLILTNKKQVRSLTLKSGEEKWVYEDDGLIGMDDRSPVVANGTVYTVSSSTSETNAALHAIDLESGEQQWRYTDSEFSAQPGEPAVAEGTVYMPQFRSLYAIDAETGEKQWSTWITDNNWKFQHDKPLVADGVVYVSAAEVVWGLDTESGDSLWEKSLSDGKVFTSTAPIVFDDTLYYSTEGKSFSLDALDAA